MNLYNLIIIALTGLLMFAYGFFSNNPDLASNILVNYLKIGVLILGGIALVNFVSFLIVDVWFVRVKGKHPSALLKLVIALVLYSACAMTILLILGRDIATIFTTSAVISAILGFALQSTLGNFFEGVALRIDQPFEIGDRIMVEDVEGWVVSITWRATTIRTDDGMLIHIPNGSLSEELVKVIPVGGQVRRSIEFLVSGAAPPQQVIDTVYEAILHQPHPNMNLDKPVRVKMWEYEVADGLLFIHYKILYYPLNYSEASSNTDRDILRRVWYALHRKGLGDNYVPPSPVEYLSLISSIEFFRDLNPDTQKILARQAKSLLFDADETLNRNKLPSRAMFVVIKGCIKVEQQLVITAGKTTVKEFSRRPKAQPPAPLKESVVEQVAYQLASYIGPSAFSLAHEVAQQTSSLYWFYQRLAAEIHDFDEREEFLKNCPPAPEELLQAGDFFGEMSLFLGEPLAAATMITALETELLVITQQAIAQALHQDEMLLDIWSQQFAQHQRDYLTETIQMPFSQELGAEAIAQQMRHLYFPHSTPSTEAIDILGN